MKARAQWRLVWALCSLSGCSRPAAEWTEQATAHIVQVPHQVPEQQRHTYENNTHHFWIFANDEAYKSASGTAPRSELRFKGDYTTGDHQFEADFLVPAGTTGVCIMQIFGGDDMHTTSLQLRVQEGRLLRYGNEILATDIYDRWIHLNVIHQAASERIEIYVDNTLRLKTSGRAGATHYFKCGVYAQDNTSKRMDVYFRNIKIWERL